MTRSSLLLAVALTLPIAAPAAPQAVSNVQFARGASSSTVTGAIRGYQFRDYRVVVRAGQMLKVNMTRLRGSPYFNVLEPGQRDVAIFGRLDQRIGFRNSHLAEWGLHYSRLSDARQRASE